MKILIAIVTVSVLSFMACSSPNAGGEMQSMPMASPESSAKSADMASSNEISPVPTRQLIKRGSMSLEVQEIKDANEQIQEIAKNTKCYLSNVNQRTTNNEKILSLTLRIPADSFDSVVKKISSFAIRIIDKSISTEDITDEYVDTEARLITKKALETRYLELLKKTKSMADILAVERELANVRGEIESMAGRMKYLTNEVSYATLDIECKETETGIHNYGNRIGQGLAFGARAAIEFFLFAIRMWPIFLFMFILLFFLRRRTKK